MSGATHSKIDDLIEVSARLGRNPLLVQAGSGNTSVKVDGVLWIKASGKWLAHAEREEILVPVSLWEERAPGRRQEPAEGLRPSIETAMHLVVPHAATIHVHSVNTIVWAVQEDGRELLSERLQGLPWQWIPYVASGVPLANEAAKAFARAPETTILVLANHGLVVCGADPFAAEELLAEVEQRLAIEPRRAPKGDRVRLEKLTQGTDWRPPEIELMHALSTDAISRTILMDGILYPCHAIFLGPETPQLRPGLSLQDAEQLYHSEHGTRPLFFLVNGHGIVVRRSMSAAERETLLGLAEVVQRIDIAANLRYLTEAEVASVLNADTYRYRGLVEQGELVRAAV